MHDVYEALVETSSPISADAVEGARHLEALRSAIRAAGGTPAGAGIHPASPFGDAPHVVNERYRGSATQMRGLLRRTPTCALHIHVGMPDPETAIRAFNRMRQHLPALQALAAHSPYWHGIDSGFQTARAQMFRGYPRADIPRAFAGWDDYVADDGRARGRRRCRGLHVLLVGPAPAPEARHARGARDGRAGPARLGLRPGRARARARARRRSTSRRGRRRSRARCSSSRSFRAGRDGLDATVWHDGALRPVRERIAAAVGSRAGYTPAEAALEEVERILRDGNGADRMRAAHAEGGMPRVLHRLIEESAEALGASARAA